MKFALLALLLAPRAFACRCDYAGVRKLQKNPASAVTAVSGVVETEGKIQTLKVERAWRGKAERIPLGSTESTCSLALDTGKRYLFLSFMTVEFMKEVPANECQALAYEMEKAAEVIRKLEAPR